MLKIPSVQFGVAAIRQPPTQISYRPRLERDKTVTILGTSKEATPTLQPYFQVLETVARILTAQGYNILTGGASGAGYQAQLGATPQRSYVIHVKGWTSVPNQDPQGNPLYRDFAVTPNAPARTSLFNKTSRILLVAPGGPGTLEEAAITLENIYYGTPGAPDFMILLGKAFYTPLEQQLLNMASFELADREKLQRCYRMVDVQPGHEQQAVEEVLAHIRGSAS